LWDRNTGRKILSNSYIYAYKINHIYIYIYITSKKHNILINYKKNISCLKNLNK